MYYYGDIFIYALLLTLTGVKMATGKKAQGLPLNLIVLAAIAALVLVLVIAFTVGGSGTFFGKIYKGGTTAVGDELTVVKSTCTSLCDQAKLATTDAAYKGSSYCKRTFNVDLDSSGATGGFDVNGNVKAGDNYNAKKAMERGLTCGSAELGVACELLIGDVAASC